MEGQLRSMGPWLIFFCKASEKSTTTPFSDRIALGAVRALLSALVSEVNVAVAAGATLEETRKRVTLAEWKEKFAGDDKVKQAAFSSFVLRAAIERPWRQAMGEAHPPPDN